MTDIHIPLQIGCPPSGSTLMQLQAPSAFSGVRSGYSFSIAPDCSHALISSAFKIWAAAKFRGRKNWKKEIVSSGMAHVEPSEKAGPLLFPRLPTPLTSLPVFAIACLTSSNGGRLGPQTLAVWLARSTLYELPMERRPRASQSSDGSTIRWRARTGSVTERGRSKRRLFASAPSSHCSPTVFRLPHLPSPALRFKTRSTAPEHPSQVILTSK